LEFVRSRDRCGRGSRARRGPARACSGWSLLRPVAVTRSDSLKPSNSGSDDTGGGPDDKSTPASNNDIEPGRARERDGETRRIIVELADTARASGMTLDARSAVREFLTQEETPSRLIVTTHGVRVAE